MNSVQRMRMVCVLVALLAALATRTAGASSMSALTCGGWSIVPSPSPQNFTNILTGVAAVSATKAWAVGYSADNGGPLHALIEQWNGTSWQVASNPASGFLFGISAVSATNVWTVGYNEGVTFVEHWDGSHWRIVKSPSVGSYINTLSSVTALSASNIWAVGYDEVNPGAQVRTLIEHWDGTRWSIVPSPNVESFDNFLEGVTSISPNDLWAVGSQDSMHRPLMVRPLVEHWNGTTWSLIHAPGPNTSGLSGATAIAANNIWTVGALGTATLTEHWDGSRWRIVKSPNLPGPTNGLVDVAAGDADNVWAVSSSFSNQENLDQTLTEQWNGSSWQIVASPNVPSQENYLNGVAMASSHTVWAVGYAQNPQTNAATTLIEYYC